MAVSRSLYVYLIAGSFLGGVGVRSLVSVSLVEVSFLAVIGLALALVCMKAKKEPVRTALFLLVLSALFFSLGIMRLEIHTWAEYPAWFERQLGKDVEVTGLVVREPEYRERSLHLYTKVNEELILITTDPYQEVSYGDSIQAGGVIDHPERFTTDLDRVFDYPGYLKAKGVYYIMRYAEVGVVDNDGGNFLLRKLFDFKQSFMHNLEISITEPGAGLSEGLLLGVKRALGEELEQVFRDTGIIHIVVLSGYNVMLVVAFVLFILARGVSPRVQVVLGLMAISLFAVLVGLGATVVRASIMASFLLLLKDSGRSYNIVIGLMLAAVGMVLFNPYVLLFDIGFQLSFLATLGLILLAEPLSKRLALLPNWIGMRDFFVATLTTQLFVLPLLLYQIGAFSLVSVVVNVLVLPMVPVAMLLTFIVGIAGFISSTLSQYLGVLALLSLTYIIETARLFANVPYASMAVPSFSAWWVAVGYLIIGYATYRFIRSPRKPVDTNMTKIAGWRIVAEDVYKEELKNKKTAP